MRTAIPALTLTALLAVTGCTITTGEPDKPAPAPTTTSAPADRSTSEPLPADCRDWIEGELLDDSASIDAGPGAEACGHLSDAEMDQAIEDVTDELIEQGAAPAS